MIGIIVNLQVEGLHSWSKCPFEDVAFLRNQHRHIFYITCKKQVKEKDRDIEIIRFKRGVENYLTTKYGKVHDFGNMSCEMIAAELINAFDLYYCSVLEDGENGAEIQK